MAAWLAGVVGAATLGWPAGQAKNGLSSGFTLNFGPQPVPSCLIGEKIVEILRPENNCSQ